MDQSVASSKRATSVGPKRIRWLCRYFACRSSLRWPRLVTVWSHFRLFGVPLEFRGSWRALRVACRGRCERHGGGFAG